MHLSLPSSAGRLLLMLLWLLAGPAAWAQAPTLTTVSPRGALVGDQVTLTGNGFTGTTGLTLAGAAVPGYTIVSDTQIRFNVPSGASTGLLTVTRPAGTSNGRPLEVGELRSLAVAGFTDDVVANGTGVAATASTSTTFDASADVLHELGYNNGSATATTGLPVGGFFVGATSGSLNYTVPPSQQYTNAVPYQLASYAASNSLRLPETGPGSGTLTLATPTAAAQLFLLTASANGGSAVDVTVTFTDNTTQTFAGLSVDDWGAGDRPALAGMGRTARATSAISAVATDPRLFQLELRLAAANQVKLVQSLTIGKTTAGSVLNVLGLSYRLRLAPTITSFTPTSGPAGTTVTVTGTNLTSVQQVRVNGVRGSLTGTPTAGSFTFVVGAGSTTGLLSLDTFGGTATSSGSFTVPPALFVASLSPARNERNAPAGSSVALTFNQALRNDAATRGSLKVYSQQRGGRMQDGARGATTVSGSTLSFNPTTDFRPGETVLSTLTPAARNSANTLSPAAGHVSQFTVAAGGTGRGALLYASQAALGGSPNSGAAADVAVGDVDGDGDLDAVAVTNTATGQVLLNNGSGVFSAGSTVALTNNQRQAELADVDGDGDLDLLVLSLPNDTVFPSGAGTFSIRLNNGSGTFGGGQDLALARGASSLAVGDVDGDGDLDAALLTPAVNGPSELRICLNTNGTLALGAAQTISSSGYALVLADLDNDGDLDIATGGPSSTQGLLVLWNGGDGSGSNTGTFSNPLLADAGAVTSASCIKAADLDNDGDLDLVLQGYISGTAVALNGGDNTGANVGTFGPGSRPIGGGAFGGYLSVGDVDADGDLDVVTAANGVQNGLVLNRNGGNATGTNAGQFTTGTGFRFISGAGQVRLTFATRLADMDGDGDLDLVAASTTQVGVWLNQPLPILTMASPNPVAVGSTLVVTGQYLTTVTGFSFLSSSPTNSAFTLNSDTQLTITVPAGLTPGARTLIVGNSYGISNGLPVTVVAPVTLAAVSPAAELPGLPVELTGTGFTSSTTVSFGGVVAASVVLNSPTSITAVVPAGAPVGSAPAVLSYAGASSSQPFAALEVYNGGAPGSCEAAVPATATVADGQWHYLLSTAGQVVAAYNYTGTSLGDFAVDALRANSAQPVRQTNNGSRYLDRNWHLTASGGTFAGRSVQLRLYGLATELARLRAADPAATPAALRALQYSGPNEDCQLSNDNFATGERRTLLAPASVPSGAGWFASELTVADHFSEFYLTAASNPLPVELTSFTATAQGLGTVRLRWATASEKNSAAFEVERSADGRTFGRIGTVAAAGRSSTARSYELLDAKLPTGTALLYYRLKQVDADGTFRYSPVRTVALTGAAAGLSLYPNPTHGAATLTGALPGTVVTVFDTLGRAVLTAPSDAAGTASLALPAGSYPVGLPTGVYVVRAGSRALRLVVE